MIRDFAKDYAVLQKEFGGVLCLMDIEGKLILLDRQHGEWFGYFDRQGNCTHTCKGGNHKGFFHLPRFLMMTAQRIERAACRA
ncbi:MAG TPA: hypothetical protein PK280_01260 [Planctomycetota bacterium]|nr:hypothetical protein [Planctomycetota bacterium]